MKLDVTAAEQSLRERVAQPLGYSGSDGTLRIADGIIAIASVAMAGAIKRITVEKGHDPRDFCLFAFGGGGPLHAFQIARELHIPLIIIPPEPGNFSALGMLLADLRLDESATFVRPLDETAISDAALIFGTMRTDMTATIRADIQDAAISFEHHAEIRYRGQIHSVRTPFDGSPSPQDMRRTFERIYKARYGHADSKNPVELVSLSLTAYGAMEKPDLKALAPSRETTGEPRTRTRPVFFSDAGGTVHTNIFSRAELPAGFKMSGPALIEEYGSTTVVGPRDRFEIGRLGEIRIHLESM